MDLLRIINLKIEHPLSPINFHETLLQENNPTSMNSIVLLVKLIDSGTIQTTLNLHLCTSI